MPQKISTFRKAVIAYTDGLDPKKADKVKGWIEHNGAKYSREITDDVTHLIVSRRAWNSYKLMGMPHHTADAVYDIDPDAVIEARRKRTIYLMNLDWLEDSLISNKKKPIDEVNEKYTWEVEHAKKVLKKRKEQQLAVKKEKLRALKLAAKEAACGDVGSSGEERSKVGRMQQIINCGKKAPASVLRHYHTKDRNAYSTLVLVC